ncbi:MAG: hypothetical protein WCI22_11400, partial [Actinomycetota bacterium]
MPVLLAFTSALVYGVGDWFGGRASRHQQSIVVAATGQIVWKFSTTAQSYATTNGVPAQPGGGVDGNGPTIAAGMVFVTS